MNWDAIGAISEMLGAIGVIASLVYVGSQVRASTKASRIDSKLRLTEKLINFGDLLIENPNLNDIMIRGRQGLKELSKEDYVQFSNLCQKACWHLSAAYFMHRNDAISDEDFHEFRFVAKYWTSSMGFRQWWEKGGEESFTGEFEKYIEQEMLSASTRASDT